MKIVYALMCAVALCFVLPCASVHEEFLTMTDIVIGNGGAVAEVTNHTDCECRRHCNVKLECLAVSRFADAPCHEANYQADTSKVVHKILPVQRGTDGLYYHFPIAPNSRTSWLSCSGNCSALHGFRLPLLKSKETFQYIKQVATENNRFVHIGLHQHSTPVARPASFTGRGKDLHYTWDDGTPLDGNMLELPSNEPVENSGKYGHVGKPPGYMVTPESSLHDVDHNTLHTRIYCVCQADATTIPHF